MIKKHVWIIPFCVLGWSMQAKAQDMASVETHEFPLHLQEAITTQRDMIFSSADSLKRLSYVDQLQTAEDSLIYSRMRKIQKTIPLAFNEKIKAYIDKYSSRNYNPYMSRLQGLAQYYFPIYEDILMEGQLPEELKYISVVESSLNPHLVSRAGAVGLWQFMYGTAKVYDLTMDAYIDERKDPYAACYAASRYFKDAYDEFGDWLLAMASYNCGRGAVRRAIERSGLERPDFWQLSPFLPAETRDYVPKFIAMNYVLRHADIYGIEAVSTEFEWEGKPIMVENNVDLGQIAKAVNLPLETLKKFNPCYKRTVVVASAERPKRLIVPETHAMNDSLLYAALNNRLEPTPQLLATTKEQSANRNVGRRYTTYTVRKGDTLSHIAQKFKGSTVTRIKADNNLRTSSLRVGQKLKIQRI